VVPCYNEAERLDLPQFQALLAEPGFSILFVDDGSSDQTLPVLQAFTREHKQVSVLALSPNRGKGEAVRQGMLNALESDPDVLGFIDADLATPIDEVVRLAQELQRGVAEVVIGSRISFLGTQIERKLARHLVGRVFATAASLTLDSPIYDTQCGAKFFQNSEVLADVLSEKFHSRWAFDVELLGRLLAEQATIVELPLRRWVDVPGSKINVKAMIMAGLDLLQIRAQLAKRSKGSR